MMIATINSDSRSDQGVTSVDREDKFVGGETRGNGKTSETLGCLVKEEY